MQDQNSKEKFTYKENEHLAYIWACATSCSARVCVCVCLLWSQNMNKNDIHFVNPDLSSFHYIFFVYSIPIVSSTLTVFTPPRRREHSNNRIKYVKL